jgi:hypothetical protein
LFCAGVSSQDWAGRQAGFLIKKSSTNKSCYEKVKKGRKEGGVDR